MSPQDKGSSGGAFALAFPSELIDAIAQAVAAKLTVTADAAQASPYLDVDEAAEYLRASSRQRVYDLVHGGSLQPHRDGRRLLFHRNTLDAYLRGEA